jgi:hypothetical protein
MLETPRRRSGGRDGRHLLRAHAVIQHEPFLTRTMAPFEVLSEEGLALLEWNADTILQEAGIDFRGDPAARETLRLGGCDVDGDRVRFPRGLARQIIQATASGRSTPGTPPGTSRSATRTWSSRRTTARRSFTTWTAAAGTPRWRTSATSSS